MSPPEPAEKNLSDLFWMIGGFRWEDYSGRGNAYTIHRVGSKIPLDFTSKRNNIQNLESPAFKI